jgi:hypothetical protein
MKDLIRKILSEETGNKVIKNYVTKMWNDQVRSGKIPMLNIVDLERKKLSTYIDEITKWYLEFVGGEEKAFQLFKKYLENKVITDKDVNNPWGIIDPIDIYKVKITTIYNLDYRGNRIMGSNEELEFGFRILDGQFSTSNGILTLEELYEERYDDIWLDVTDFLRSEIEDYVSSVVENFGLQFDDHTSHWDD